MMLIPVLVIVSAGAGMAGCRAAGVNPHLPQLVLAAIVILIAASAGLLPVAIQHSLTPVAIFQSAFLGTVAHLGLSVVMSAIVMFALRPGPSFVWWVLGLYWVTLIGLCAVFVRRLRVSGGTGVVDLGAGASGPSSSSPVGST